MKMFDNRGRLFGRFNLVDSAVVAFLLILVPLGYGTYLLFRPATPRIESVTPAEVSRQERRIGGGGLITAKFKVKGTGLNPMLRAFIGDTQALAFVFENPNSADVLVGPVAPGAHDLVLFDGVQEVARARGAIAVKPGEATFIRATGWLTDLGADLASALQVGLKVPESAPMFEIIALGPLQPGRARVSLAGSHIDLPLHGMQEREAVLGLRCDPAREDNPCTLGERLEGQRKPVVLSLPGPVRYFHFSLYELLPTTAPRKARIEVRLTGNAPLLQAGDRDALMDGRAAVVTTANGKTPGSLVTLDLGVDDTREGWQYRSQPIKPGAPFVLQTKTYDAAGKVESLTLLAPTVGAPK